MGRSRKKYKAEKCVACGARTNYSKQDPIDYRYGYVEGEGQFCFKCSYFVRNPVNKMSEKNLTTSIIVFGIVFTLFIIFLIFVMIL